MPSKAKADLLQVGVLASDYDLPNGSAIFVGLVGLHLNLFTKNLIRQMILDRARKTGLFQTHQYP